uniref:Uncharacterized protein n=1 Tax=Anguilla anguilla TaxID=7936 RepID=A0A0E9SKQ2_ANGAN
MKAPALKGIISHHGNSDDACTSVILSRNREEFIKSTEAS